MIVGTEKIAGVPCITCVPPSPSGITMYLHGGGYRFGSTANSRAFATRLAKRTQTTVIGVEYRLAPEYPFPAALTDVVAVYDYYLGTSTPPFLVADSAGGGLAASLTVAAAAAGLPRPRAMVLMSPWLDLECTSGTFALKAASDQLFSRRAAEEAATMYVQGYDTSDPLLSPVHVSHAAWPPTLLMASTDEVLLQDSLSWATMLALAGTNVTCYFRGGVPHDWPVNFPDLPESELALQEIEAFTKTL